MYQMHQRKCQILPLSNEPNEKMQNDEFPVEVGSTKYLIFLSDLKGSYSAQNYIIGA